MNLDKKKGNDITKLPATCRLDGPIPDPRNKKEPTQAEKEHVAHYHTKYGGSLNHAWFTRLNLPPGVQKLISYPESCVVVSEDGSAVGKMYTSITMNEWANQPCLLVYSGTYARLRPGLEVGTDITGFVTRDIGILQELGHEWVRLDGRLLDRKTFLMNEPDGRLYCHIILRKDEEVQYEKHSFVEYADLSTFVSEASSILLQRIIIQQKKVGDVDLKCLTSNGKVVKCNYRVLGNGFESIKGQEQKVWGIRKSVWTDSGVHCWDSLFNYYGRLVLRCQPAENDFAMIPLWFKPVEEFDDSGKFTGMLPPLVWGCDAQLFSQYNVRKVELASEYKKYLLEHPDLRAVLSDFVQKLLIQKPRNLVEFSKTYFQQFLQLNAGETTMAPEETEPIFGGSNESPTSSVLGELLPELGESASFENMPWFGMDDTDYGTQEILEPRYISATPSQVDLGVTEESRPKSSDQTDKQKALETVGLRDALNEIDTNL